MYGAIVHTVCATHVRTFLVALFSLCSNNVILGAFSMAASFFFTSSLLSSLLIIYYAASSFSFLVGRVLGLAVFGSGFSFANERCTRACVCVVYTRKYA